jgi:hypothetical protein
VRDPLPCNRPAFGLRLQHAIDRLHDVPAAAVIGGDSQIQTGISGRQVFRVADELDQTRLEAREVADYAQPDAVLVQSGNLLLPAP